MKNLKIILQILILNLIYFSSHCQTPNLCGIWYSDQFQCPAGTFHHEIFSISDSFPHINATKIIGDSCVTTGHVSFYSDSLLTDSAFLLYNWVGSPQQPNYFAIPCFLIIIDSNHFQIQIPPIDTILGVSPDTIDIYKYSCHQLDSLHINPSNYGLPCNCITVISELNTEYNSSKAYPNPFSSYTKITFNKEVRGGMLCLYNAFGEKVQEFKDFNGNYIFISGNALKEGIYFYQVLDASNYISNGKLIVN